MRRSILAIAMSISLTCSAQVNDTYTLWTLLTKNGNDLYGACNGCPTMAQIVSLGGVNHWISGFPDSTYYVDLASDGTYVWASSLFGQYYRVDLHFFYAVPFSGLDYPGALAYDGANMWVVNHSTINKIDDATGSLLSSIDAGGLVGDILFDHSGNLWALLDSGFVLKYPPGSALPSATIAVGKNTSYNRREIGYDGASIWVPSPSGTIRINTATNSIVGNYTTVGTKMAFDGAHMWMLTPSGFSRLNDDGQIADNYQFVFGGDGTDILFDGTQIVATNASMIYNVQVAALAPLPVKFTQINSSCTGSGVVIKWKAEGNQTASFLLERSANGSKWERVGTVQPNPSGSYSFTDKNVSSENLYRISETENTGRLYMSTIFKSDCAAPAAYAIFPNPARNQTTINFSANEEGQGKIRVYNSGGMLVKTFEREIMKGENQIPLDVTMMPAGMYQIITTWGGNLKSASFVKQ